MSENPPSIRDRSRLLAEVDSIFNRAEESERRGIASPALVIEFTQEAVHLFHLAATRYQDLGFGLAARQAWDRAAWCCRTLAKEQIRTAQKYDELMEQIPVPWIETE